MPTQDRTRRAWKRKRRHYDDSDEEEQVDHTLSVEDKILSKFVNKYGLC